MVDPITGIDTEQAKLADIVNRQNVGTSQRFRNEQIRKQTQSGQSPDLASATATSDIPKIYTPPEPNYERNVFGKIVYKPYTYSSPFENDPTFQSLSSKYKYVQPDYQPYTQISDSPAGYDFRKNPYGSFDLGNHLFLAPKLNLANAPFGMPESNESYLNSKYYNPYNEDGTFNPEGWEVRSNKSQAMGGVIGTLGILGAAAGPGMFGPGGGTAGTLGSENMFFGGTSAIAPTATQSAGMFGNQAWDLGNKYVNKAAEGALKGFLFSGGNPTAALQGGLTGPVGGYISESLNPYVGDIASKSLGGAASGTLASLFTKNNPIAGSLYGGMSGGLNAYLNSVNANSDTFNKMASNTLSGLVRKKLFRNK